jgi:dTDP-glucose 4,6-dehydratase
LAVALRYDFNPPAGTLEAAVALGVGLAALQLLIGFTFSLYRGRYVVGSFDEVLGVVLTTSAVGVVGSIVLVLWQPAALPRTAPVIATGLAAASMLGARFLWRGAQRQSALNRSGSRTLIYGAGDAGSQIVDLMLADRGGQFQPVGFIDDDPRKQHLRRSGVRVLGTVADLEPLVRRDGIQTLLVAIAGISASRLLDLDRRCKPLGVTVRIIPTASEIAGGAVKLGDISDVTEEDLMGRHPIETDERSITDFIAGKRILVTGAGGSIGSELSRQLARYNPAQLILLDRDESVLHAVQLTLDGSGTLTSEDLILADIRDRERIHSIMESCKPDIVFHAAALKHLPLLERFPEEALKTNVLGTRNVLEAAHSSDVRVFVNISTDKAADPTSVLGYSKLITERLTASMPADVDQKYVSVRFGNVLGSRGSVLHTFRYQIAQGGPVTVTHEDVTRYFMTVGEAVHLVLQASVLGRHGETLILDMGTPVKIADVARYMIDRSGRDIDIVFTGMRPGEKLHEVLVAGTESPNRPFHPLISHAVVAPLEAASFPNSFSGNAHDWLTTWAVKPANDLSP